MTLEEFENHGPVGCSLLLLDSFAIGLDIFGVNYHLMTTGDAGDYIDAYWWKILGSVLQAVLFSSMAMLLVFINNIASNTLLQIYYDYDD